MTEVPSDFDHLMPFATACGIRFERVAADEVVSTMEWAADLCTTSGMVHGGALMTLADTAGAVCALLNLPPGAGTSTIESKTNFFRALRQGRAVATTRPLHVGRTTVVVQTDVHDDQGRRLAQTTQTQAVLAPTAEASS